MRLGGEFDSIRDFTSGLLHPERTLHPETLGAAAEFDLDPDNTVMKHGVLYALAGPVSRAIDFARDNPKIVATAIAAGAAVGTAVFHAVDNLSKPDSSQIEPQL